MGSDCSLVHCFKYFLACSPSGIRKFAKNSHPASGFCFCLGSVLFPGLPLVKCDTKVCCFFDDDDDDDDKWILLLMIG